jgi:hypothetical protein
VSAFRGLPHEQEWLAQYMQDPILPQPEKLLLGGYWLRRRRHEDGSFENVYCPVYEETK